MKRILCLFSYVKTLEQQAKQDERLIASMTRHINALEALRADQQVRLDALQKERDELSRHLNGRSS